jgi:hypothetical protein
MQFRRRVLVAAAVAFVAIVAAAVLITNVPSSDNTSPVKSTTATSTVNPNIAKAKQEALAYLISPARAKRFADLVAKAGPTLAHGLENGTFGPTEIHDTGENPVPADYTGNGTITTPDSRIYANVYFQNGKIDYTQPITLLCITSKDAFQNGTDSNTETHLIEPFKATANEPAYWQGYLGLENGAQQGTDARGIEFPDQPWPHSLNGFKQLTDRTLAQFESNMTSWFGKNW